jgi:hypothetical protein
MDYIKRRCKERALNDLREGKTGSKSKIQN